MIAYKFLRSGRLGPFSGFHWPDAGVWVRTGEDRACGRAGIHACRVRDLPWWLADELWEIELEGESDVYEHKIIARAGRLRSRVEAWTTACADEYAEACAWRARERAIEALGRAGHESAAVRLGASGTLKELRTMAGHLADERPDTRISLLMAQDAADCARIHAAPTAAYIAAHAARRIDGPPGYDAERDWQSSWLARRLRLDHGAA